MNAQELLIKSKAVIADPANHAKGAFARDVDGNATAPSMRMASSYPICWCSIGAIASVLDTTGAEVICHWAGLICIEALAALNNSAAHASSDGTTGISKFNDTNSHAETMAVWDAAIASF